MEALEVLEMGKAEEEMRVDAKRDKFECDCLLGLLILVGLVVDDTQEPRCIPSKRVRQGRITRPHGYILTVYNIVERASFPSAHGTPVAYGLRITRILVPVSSPLRLATRTALHAYWHIEKLPR
jgi:hypothetical protein